MRKLSTLFLALVIIPFAYGQDNTRLGDSLKNEGLLMPALIKYAESMAAQPTAEVSYQIASTTALLWNTAMSDTTFYFLNIALQNDSSLNALYDPDFLSLIDNPKWEKIENDQIRKYEAKNEPIKNKAFAKALFRMIIKDQGFMYIGNIERKKYIDNGGYFSTPAIFPILDMEAKNKKENEEMLLKLLDKYGWPTASEVTEYAAAGAALIINHSNYEVRAKYFPLLEQAFKKGEAQALRYAKMRDRILVEEGKEQLYGTQIKFENLKRELYPIKDPEFVDKRRAEIGLGPLKPYLKARFDMDWDLPQKN